jgi:hypothetical protein
VSAIAQDFSHYNLSRPVPWIPWWRRIYSGPLLKRRNLKRPLSSPTVSAFHGLLTIRRA